MHPLRLGIPILLIALFVVYVLYLALSKKDARTIKRVLYPGLFFISVWIVIYFFVLK